MAPLPPAHPPTDGSLVLGRTLRRRDLHHAQLREQIWDQIHPRTGRFRPSYYQKSKPWQISSETFVDQTELGEVKFLDWVTGTYYVDLAILDGICDEKIQEPEFIVRLTLVLDFTKVREQCIQWAIDARTSQADKQAAYPGIHRGNLLMCNDTMYNSFCKVRWQTLLLSPYVNIEMPDRQCDREDFAAVSMTSIPKGWTNGDSLLRAGHRERVVLSSKNCYSIVLQEVLKDLARLLVWGPRYSDMQQPPAVEYELVNDGHARADETMKLFGSPEFSGVAAFFSRAFCQASMREEEELPIPEGHCLQSIKTIEGLFDRYKIMQEPRWVKANQQDWVDNLREEAMEVRTISEWRNFETRWAIITSYACGLNLHEGPWAGEEWRKRVDLKMWD